MRTKSVWQPRVAVAGLIACRGAISYKSAQCGCGMHGIVVRGHRDGDGTVTAGAQQLDGVAHGAGRAGADAGGRGIGRAESDPAERAAVLEQELREVIVGEVRFDDMTRGLYSTDASIYQITPVGVVFPRHHADVVAAVRIASKYRIPIVARGSGTSLSGQTIGNALILDLSRFMNRVLEFDVKRKLIRVEPGIVLDELNAFLKPHGLMFGPDVATSSRANIGGMLGNNSAGSHSVVQGKMIDHVRAVRLVLDDGDVLDCGPVSAAELERKSRQTDREGAIYRGVRHLVDSNRREIFAKYPRILRRVSGYNLDAFLPDLQDQFPTVPEVRKLDAAFPERRDFNLARLVVGAEGTLGVVTEVLLHAVPRPKERGVVCLQFDTSDHALESVMSILSCDPSAVEVLDHHIVELSRQNLKYKSYLDFIQGTPEAILIVEFMGETPEVVHDGILLLKQKMEGQPGLLHFLPATDAEQRDKIWNCRKAGAPLLLSIPGARKPIAFVEDTAVEPKRLPEFTRRFRDILTKHNITGSYYGHASVGCLHIRPMIDTKSAGDLAILKSVSDEVADLVKEFGGAMTGEHGDGLARSYHNIKLFGPKLFQAFVDVKELFDPHGLMNPGKIAAMPSPIENLRYGTEYHGRERPTFLNFDREERLSGAPGQGLLAAAEMCNGSAVCRKTLTGTMCPSYMVTRDEEHSTRGRANALRLALSGQMPEGALTSRRMFEVFDLCLMCKACKSECPSNVDVAKMKVEFLAHYYTEHRPSLGTVMMAHVAWINRLGSALAPLSNWLLQVPGANVLGSWLGGVDARRRMPKFVRHHFAAWFRSHTPASRAGWRGKVLLLDDCLTSYCEPGINRSATDLLEAAGYAVERADLWCCGRPFISKGLIEKGKSLVRENVAKLLPYVEAGVPIVGAEPSCLLTLVDEYPDLLPSPATELIKRHSFLVDQFLADRLKEDPALLAFKPRNEKALLHGHCQQKALVGTAATKRLLGCVPGLDVQELDSGCCGMAGSFGYEHFDISQKIGNRVLFPAVRAHTQGPVLAPGFSCRHQVSDATQAHPLHPLELLREQLVSPT